jgi:glutathione S-transferase
MALTLHYHPLSSFCQKAVIGLYEAGAAFDPQLVNLGDQASRDAFLAVWPIGKFPVLQDDAGAVIPESTIIIEYLARNAPGGGALVPTNEAEALQVRKWDRIFDNYVEHQFQRVVGDRLRPADARDPAGVEYARGQLRSAYALLESAVSDDGWMVGDSFTLADCGAAPALYYAELIEPFQADHPRLAAYYARLCARPSVARTFSEADPYRHLFPTE